jgi:hypothetical protein
MRLQFDVGDDESTAAPDASTLSAAAEASAAAVLCALAPLNDRPRFLLALARNFGPSVCTVEALH